MKLLAIIPARGGSKGVPRKNVKLLSGKPLIAHAIQAAHDSGVFDRIIVSTDDEEIAQVARECGAEVPFMRPAELAQDSTPTLPVLVSALTWLKDVEGYVPDAIAILQPTTPLRTAQHIKTAHEIFTSLAPDSVVSMKEVPGHYSPHWQFRILENGQANIFTQESFDQIIPQRQKLPKTYTRNGAVYIAKTSLLFQDPPTFYGKDVRAFVMDEESSVNIDSISDFELAERYALRRTML